MDHLQGCGVQGGHINWHEPCQGCHASSSEPGVKALSWTVQCHMVQSGDCTSESGVSFWEGLGLGLVLECPTEEPCRDVWERGLIHSDQGPTICQGVQACRPALGGQGPQSAHGGSTTHQPLQTRKEDTVYPRSEGHLNAGVHVEEGGLACPCISALIPTC